MFIVTMAFGIIANLIVRYFERKGKNTANLDESMVVHLLNCLAGGLFFGTFLLGLLPEVRELFEGIMERYNVDTHFPVAEAATAVGFFFVMILEHLIEMCQRGASGHGHGHGGSHNHGHINGHEDGHRQSHVTGQSNSVRNSTGKGESKPSTLRTLYYSNGRYTPQNGESGLPDSHQNVNTNNRYPVTTDTSGQQRMDDLNFRLGERNLAFDPVHKDENRVGNKSTSDTEFQLSTEGIEETPHGHSQISENVMLSSNLGNGGEQSVEAELGTEGTAAVVLASADKKPSFLRAFVLVLALSLHTLFEGLALGLQRDEATIWTLLIAVSVHKAVIVIALSIELSKGGHNTIKRIYITLIVFAIMSPIGVGVGIAITETGAPNDLATDTASSILQGLAGGTFLYVTFFEVLNRELENGYDLRKVLSVMIGFSAIIGLQFLEHSQAH
ncbi:zinc transporter ZIP1-like [Liolophura sinensis]|uniref:zinc transporter ZIP1-like n=1 Tax=Liolophura sinensis TaxID=3198878 RepID=UPI00315929AA